MTIEEHLENIMQTKGITKAQLSKGANIPYTTIDGMLKRGCHNIKLSTLIKLADFFGLSIDYLVGRSSESEYTLDELMELETFKQYLLFRRKENEKWAERKVLEKAQFLKPLLDGGVKYHWTENANL